MGQGYMFASKRFICMVPIFSFLVLYSNTVMKKTVINFKVGFVTFSMPDFIENLL